ncbi:hypothetical protein [Amycolatopsis antarctica]|uniref:hypothetical protein n=1 Tax=Amycolatopsis antarctica TaxID=1854586 RepID=UPI00196A5AF7|nr:hypothetical protein [Amycolatopsis antarctica]
MRKGGYQAIEAAGMVVTALSAQAVIRGFFNRDSEPLWGVVNWVAGGVTGQLVLLGVIAIVAMLAGGWAHTRPEPATERTGGSGQNHGRRTG